MIINLIYCSQNGKNSAKIETTASQSLLNADLITQLKDAQKQNQELNNRYNKLYEETQIAFTNNLIQDQITTIEDLEIQTAKQTDKIADLELQVEQYKKTEEALKNQIEHLNEKIMGFKKKGQKKSNKKQQRFNNIQNEHMKEIEKLQNEISYLRKQQEDQTEQARKAYAANLAQYKEEIEVQKKIINHLAQANQDYQTSLQNKEQEFQNLFEKLKQTQQENQKLKNNQRTQDRKHQKELDKLQKKLDKFEKTAEERRKQKQTEIKEKIQQFCNAQIQNFKNKIQAAKIQREQREKALAEQLAKQTKVEETKIAPTNIKNQTDVLKSTPKKKPTEKTEQKKESIFGKEKDAIQNILDESNADIDLIATIVSCSICPKEEIQTTNSTQNNLSQSSEGVINIKETTDKQVENQRQLNQLTTKYPNNMIMSRSMCLQLENLKSQCLQNQANIKNIKNTLISTAQEIQLKKMILEIKSEFLNYLEEELKELQKITPKKIDKTIIEYHKNEIPKAENEILQTTKDIADLNKILMSSLKKQYIQTIKNLNKKLKKKFNKLIEICNNPNERFNNQKNEDIEEVKKTTNDIDTLLVQISQFKEDINNGCKTLEDIEKFISNLEQKNNSVHKIIISFQDQQQNNPETQIVEDVTNLDKATENFNKAAQKLKILQKEIIPHQNFMNSMVFKSAKKKLIELYQAELLKCEAAQKRAQTAENFNTQKTAIKRAVMDEVNQSLQKNINTGKIEYFAQELSKKLNMLEQINLANKPEEKIPELIAEEEEEEEKKEQEIVQEENSNNPSQNAGKTRDSIASTIIEIKEALEQISEFKTTIDQKTQTEIAKFIRFLANTDNSAHQIITSAETKDESLKEKLLKENFDQQHKETLENLMNSKQTLEDRLNKLNPKDQEAVELTKQIKNMDTIINHIEALKATEKILREKKETKNNELLDPQNKQLDQKKS